MDGDGDTNMVPSEPPTSEVMHNHPAPPGNLVDRVRQLEEEVDALKQQLWATEGRAELAEYERDAINREMSEMVDRVAQYFGMSILYELSTT